MTEGLKFCSWYLQNTLFLPFSDILLICLIPAFPVVWNCPTRANFAVYFYPMNLLWLLGCSQGTSPAGFRAIWMKSSPPKAGTMASTSCHTFRTTHVADNPLKTAELLQTQLCTASHQEVWAQKSEFLFYLFIYWRMHRGFSKREFLRDALAPIQVSFSFSILWSSSEYGFIKKCWYFGRKIFILEI